MNAIAKYERRHSICNDDISLGRNGGYESSTAASSIGSISSSRSEEGNASSESSPSSQRKPLAANWCRWRIDSSHISELPEIYPRLSSPLIVRDREVSEIGDKLWSFLRTNEIRSVYDRQEGRVLCCTERVSFVVQFWRRRRIETSDKNNKNDEEIILEIQRRQGCSWAMHKVRSALKKTILRRHHSSHNHHRNNNSEQQKMPRRHSLFPPPPQRSHSERFGLMRLEPMILPCSIQPLELKESGHNSSKNEEWTSENIQQSELPKALFSSCLPPLRPTFGVCPTPPTTVHRF